MVEKHIPVKLPRELQLLIDRMRKRQIHLRELVRPAHCRPAKKNIRRVEIEMSAENIFARIKPDLVIVFSCS